MTHKTHAARWPLSKHLPSGCLPQAFKRAHPRWIPQYCNYQLPDHLYISPRISVVLLHYDNADMGKVENLGPFRTSLLEVKQLEIHLLTVCEAPTILVMAWRSILTQTVMAKQRSFTDIVIKRSLRPGSLRVEVKVDPGAESNCMSLNHFRKLFLISVKEESHRQDFFVVW